MIVLAGPRELADLATADFPRVLAVVADLGDPALAGLLALEPTSQDLADAARPGASPRTHFQARRALTRWLVARRCGVAPAAVAVGYDAGGAPRVLTPPSACFVSVAGRGSLAAIALADRPVGIDMEPLAGAGAPVWDVLHPDEAAMLRALPAAERPRAFLAIWTAKEAGLKALGEGFTREPSGVRVVGDEPRRQPLPASAWAPLRSPHASHPSFTLVDSTLTPLAHGVWTEREGALVAVALA